MVTFVYCYIWNIKHYCHLCYNNWSHGYYHGIKPFIAFARYASLSSLSSQTIYPCLSLIVREVGRI